MKPEYLDMLWYDGDKGRTFVEKMSRAIEYYDRKYGCKPNRCAVSLGQFAALPAQLKAETHPALVFDTAPSSDTTVMGVVVVGSKYILPNHYLFSSRGQ